MGVRKLLLRLFRIEKFKTEIHLTPLCASNGSDYRWQGKVRGYRSICSNRRCFKLIFLLDIDIGRSVYLFLKYIYTFQRDTQCCSTDCLLMLRCQLYMFRTVTVHSQELLFRCCMCRLWYVVRTALSDTSRCYQRDYQHIP